MAVLDVSGSGTFLVRSLNPDALFTPEDLTDEQRLFGRTAAEFMRNEVLPNEASLYAHDWGKRRELLKKAADLDLLRLEIPAAYGGLGLDKVSAAYVGEYLAINPSCYAIESAIGRAEKMTARGSERAAIAADIARVYTSDALDRVAHDGKQIVNALAGRNAPVEPLNAALARVRALPGIDTVNARRRIGDAAIARTRYPF